ncbi:MAG: AraC family transcriptional regulator [Phycisphaeraceae bacterium]
MKFVYDQPVPDGRTDGSHIRDGVYSAWLVRHGCATVESHGDTAEVGPGQWLFCFGNRITQRLSPDCHLLSVCVEHCWPDGSLLFADGRALVQLPAADCPQLEPLALKFLRDVGLSDSLIEHPGFAFRWQTRLDYRSYRQHQMHLLLWTEHVSRIAEAHGLQLRIPGGVDSRLAHVLNRLDSLPFDAPYPSKQITAGSGLSLGQLNRMCQGAYGVTLYGYWNQTRSQHARFLLEQTDLNVKQVALGLGFKQQSHFSAWFKRDTGRSPLVYRRDYRAGH